MLEQQYKEKTVILENLKAEISEFNVRKSGLTKEINLQLIEAKAKADKLLSEAEERAKAISVAIDIEQSKAIEYTCLLYTSDAADE